VSDIILSSADVVVNTTSRAEGTVVGASCRSGFALQGSPVITCVKGSWNHPTPTCIASSPAPTPEPEGSALLPERDIIIIAVCCGVVLLILIGLIVSIVLYRRLHRTSTRHKTTYPGLRSTRGHYNPPYSYNWYLQHGLQSPPSVASAPQSGYFLPGEKSLYGDRIEPVYSVMWDADKMEWHDSFDYSRVKSIPRPKVNSTSLEQWAFPYNYTN